TGTLNAATQVATVAGLVGTTYGRLLLVKLALLLPILALAAVNRRRHLPRLGGDGATVRRPAMLRLARLVGWEAALALLPRVVRAARVPPPRGRPPPAPLPAPRAPLPASAHRGGRRPPRAARPPLPGRGGGGRRPGGGASPPPARRSARAPHRAAHRGRPLL